MEYTAYLYRQSARRESRLEQRLHAVKISWNRNVHTLFKEKSSGTL